MQVWERDRRCRGSMRTKVKGETCGATNGALNKKTELLGDGRGGSATNGFEGAAKSHKEE